MVPVRISEQEISRKIRKLRKDAASGPDKISPRILQQLESSLLLPLKLIFEETLIIGTVPIDWK
jgi:hypothetical protein